LYGLELDQTASALRDVDDEQLVAFCQRDISPKPAPLFADHVPHVYAFRSGRKKPILERHDHGLVAPFSGPVRQSFCPRLVGVLNGGQKSEARVQNLITA